MKSVKLSLAAVVAAGAFSAANAVALDEAIQNVDLHGMLRYRYDSERKHVGTDDREGIPAHKVKAKINISSEIADNFKAHGRIEYNVEDESYGHDQNSNTHNGIEVREAYLEYNNFDTSFKVGKMEIKSIWTDGVIGDGVTVTNNSVEGLTFAAFMFDNFDKTNGDLYIDNEASEEPGKPAGGAGDSAGSDKPTTSTIDLSATEKITTLTADYMKAVEDAVAKAPIAPVNLMLAQISLQQDLAKFKVGDIKTADQLSAQVKKILIDNYGAAKLAKGGAAAELAKASKNKVLPVVNMYDHNLYGAAVMANFEPVSAQAWIAYLNKVGTFYAADLGVNLEVSDGFNVNVHTQAAFNSLKGEVKDLGAANSTFLGLEGGIEVAGLDAKMGWVNFGKTDKYTVQVLHDKGQLINSGEIVMDGYHGTFGKHNYIFSEVGYTFEGLRAGVDIITGTVKDSDGKVKLFEVTPRLSYKYSDKLNFSTFYAMGQSKIDGQKDKERLFRLEAKYSF